MGQEGERGEGEGGRREGRTGRGTSETEGKKRKEKDIGGRTELRSLATLGVNGNLDRSDRGKSIPIFFPGVWRENPHGGKKLLLSSGPDVLKTWKKEKNRARSR